MNIWSKVLVGVILVLTLPFLYLSMYLLNANRAWRDEVTKYQNAVRDAVNGRPGQDSLDALAEAERKKSVKLHDIIVDRGRVWRNVQPERAFNPTTGQGTVAVQEPTPHRIAQKMILFAFDGTGYLGEFQVAEAGEKTVTLSPNMKLSERELKRLAASPGTWTLYEVMPLDRHDVFAGLDQATLEKMLPAERVSDYVRDGQEAQPGDPQARVFNGKFERQLTDYAMLFHELDRQIAVAADLRTAAAKDAASLDLAVADAKKQVAAHETEIADLKTELARSQAERNMMKTQVAALEKEIASTRAKMKAEFQANRARARDWAEIQTRLAAAHEAAPHN